MVFTSSALDVRLEFDDPPTGTYDCTTDSTIVTGCALVRVQKAAAAVHGIRIEFTGEEVVNLRAWASLSSTTVSRQVLYQRITVHRGGVLHEGQHRFAFRLRIPAWVPSSLDRSDLCRIRYVMRAVVERPKVAGLSLVCEEEIECRRLRASRRLARRKRIDQSVGCPDGSCHVRFTGSISRDVVRPGAQIKLDVSARTSDARFGLRLLAANFAECVMCHVQVKGEERLVNKITNLVACRLDALPSVVEGNDGVQSDAVNQQANRGSMRSDPGRSGVSASVQCASPTASDVEAVANVHSRRHLTRGIRKTRSRLAVLLRSTSPAEPIPPQPVPNAPSSPQFHLHPSSATGRTSQLNVVRQIRASQIIQVPLGLSQFSSEYISREYRLMIVAEVAPLVDPEVNGDSIHTNDSSMPQPPHVRPPRPTPPSMSPAQPLADSRRRRSSSASSSSSSDSAVSIASGAVENGAQPVAPPSPRWTISENSSAIAGWPVDVVERFDVRFDELVSSTSSKQQQQQLSSPIAVTTPSDAELIAGEYTFYSASQAIDEVLPPSVSEPGTAELPALALQSSSSPASSEHQRSGDTVTRGHHRRTSSGLVGFLMRGFRSSSSATVPCASPPPMPVTPPQVESLRAGDGRRRLNHVRSVSSVVHGSRDTQRRQQF
ncbi:hypothetical protein GGH94_005104 [Coemansia aciculifera]|uniref:Arrestin-like N-terminal domain-containing protein n=1 Tax=Coemansia aciculifera TaxID=417176 RepID=A0A9W8IM48_9FUNG|nr:hypothetical protein GGH94_005104 [Coemansia aciculifera]KAJ2872480.1 hypothetical protein GGH93_003994 [Coemansia aciculifera]